MSFLMAINSLGPILGPIVGSFVLSISTWQTIFYILVVWGILLLVLSKGFVDETLVVEKRAKSVIDSLRQMKTDILNLKFMLTAISLSFIMGGFFSYLAASPFVFQVIYGFTLFEYSLTFAAIAIFLATIASQAGRFARRTSDLKVVIFAYTLMILAGLSVLIEAIVVPESHWFVFVSLAIYCAMMGTSQSAGFSVFMSFRKGGAGAASGIFGVLNFLFGALCSPLVGLLGEKSMLPLGLNLFVCAILATLLLLVALKLKKS